MFKLLRKIQHKDRKVGMSFSHEDIKIQAHRFDSQRLHLRHGRNVSQQ